MKILHELNRGTELLCPCKTLLLQTRWREILSWYFAIIPGNVINNLYPKETLNNTLRKTWRKLEVEPEVSQSLVAIYKELQKPFDEELINVIERLYYEINKTLTDRIGYVLWEVCKTSVLIAHELIHHCNVNHHQSGKCDTCPYKDIHGDFCDQHNEIVNLERSYVIAITNAYNSGDIAIKRVSRIANVIPKFQLTNLVILFDYYDDWRDDKVIAMLKHAQELFSSVSIAIYPMIKK